MTPELPKKNLKHEELDIILSLVFDEPAFPNEDNTDLDQGVNSLTSALEQAFKQNPEYSDFFEARENSKGPSLKAIRASLAARNGVVASISSQVEEDKTLPNRDKLNKLWGLIGHLSHGEDLDAVFEANPQIEQMITEICSIVGVNQEAQEAVEQAKQQREAAKSEPIDFNALAASIRERNSGNQ